MDWQLIESDRGLQEVVAQASRAGAVAIDTEFMRRNTFYPQVALVQLCFDETAWLIDPLTLEDPSPLADLLVDPEVIKVLHSASEDLEVFQQWLGVLPQPLFDTQRAAALLDAGFGLSYRALVLAVCGVDLPKGETRSDWLQRPLTDSQCEYAAQDVTWLLQVWRKLDQQCEAQGKRDWVLADGRDALGALATNAGGYYNRIKTAWKLNPRELGILIAVCDWRERIARERDKPRSWIIDDKACLQLAQTDPRNWNQLKSQVELPAPAQRRYGEDLLALLAAQRATPDAELPPRLPQPLDAPQRQQLKNLKSSAREIAAGAGVAPEVLLPSKDYEILIREAAGAEVDTPRHWEGWRKDLVLSPLRRLLMERAS